MAIFGKKNPLQRSYDAVADEYAKRIYTELDDKPADRELLDNFAEALQGSGPCVELGCGPGHVTRYLAERGLDISGIDSSKKMVKKRANSIRESNLVPAICDSWMSRTTTGRPLFPSIRLFTPR